MRRFVSCGLVVVLGLVACAAPEQDRFTFQHNVAGKADGVTALLPAEQVALLDTRLQAAIQAADAQIASLQSQIAQGESDLASKQSRIDSLIREIESRKQVVTNNYNNSINIGLLGALFGFPLVTAASLVQALDQDSLLQRLNSDLTSAKRDRDNVAATIADYKQRKAALTAQLQPVKDNYAALKTLLAATGGKTYVRPDGIEATAWTKVSGERGRIALLGDIAASGSTQIDLLKKLLALVTNANSAVAQAVTTVEALAKAAQEAEAESNALFQSLLEIALARDPNAAAQKWLEDALASKTKAALSSLGWPVESFVDGLLDGVNNTALAQQLIAAINTATGTTTPSTEETTLSVATAANGFDFTWSNAPAGEYDWIGVFPSDADMSVDVELWWDFTYAKKSGSLHFAETLPAGSYNIYYFVDGTYDFIARAPFIVK